MVILVKRFVVKEGSVGSGLSRIYFMGGFFNVYYYNNNYLCVNIY